MLSSSTKTGISSIKLVSVSPKIGISDTLPKNDDMGVITITPIIKVTIKYLINVLLADLVLGFAEYFFDFIDNYRLCSLISNRIPLAINNIPFQSKRKYDLYYFLITNLK